MGLTREDYEAYVRAFNARDYDALCEFFADDVVMEAHGFTLDSAQAIRDFYSVFHAHVRETVTLKAFYEGPTSSIAEATINFVGEKELTPDVMTANGLPAGPAVPKGASFDIDYFIAYDRPDGKITRIRAAVIEPAAA